MDIEKIISNTLNTIELTKEEIEKSLRDAYLKGLEDGKKTDLVEIQELSPYEAENK